jgi:hypothetical protein
VLRPVKVTKVPCSDGSLAHPTVFDENTGAATARMNPIARHAPRNTGTVQKQMREVSPVDRTRMRVILRAPSARRRPTRSAMTSTRLD